MMTAQEFIEGKLFKDMVEVATDPSASYEDREKACRLVDEYAKVDVRPAEQVKVRQAWNGRLAG